MVYHLVLAVNLFSHIYSKSPQYPNVKDNWMMMSEELSIYTNFDFFKQQRSHIIPQG